MQNAMVKTFYIDQKLKKQYFANTGLNKTYY